MLRESTDWLASLPSAGPRKPYRHATAELRAKAHSSCIIRPVRGCLSKYWLPMNIENAVNADYPELIEIWEASVRATHDFLSEEDLQELKPAILNQYSDAVDLKCAKTDDGEILGFCGVSNGNIEMLFVSPNQRGKGIGSSLAFHAIESQSATTVDVNEQNDQAVGFYLHIGFAVTGRSPVEGQDKPYPLLHMALKFT